MDVLLHILVEIFDNVQCSMPMCECWPFMLCGLLLTSAIICGSSEVICGSSEVLYNLACLQPSIVAFIQASPKSQWHYTTLPIATLNRCLYTRQLFWIAANMDVI